MTNWVVKQAYRVPRLLREASTGDPSAIAFLTAMGIGAVYYMIKDSVKKK